jgi:hypothetical protein
LRPTQFPVDGGRIEAGSLPHFQLVDSRAGNKIGAGDPIVQFIPGIGFFYRPLRLSIDTEQQR